MAEEGNICFEGREHGLWGHLSTLFSLSLTHMKVVFKELVMTQQYLNFF